MFDEYKKHLVEENSWLREQVKELQAKLFKATRLNDIQTEPAKKLKFDMEAKQFVQMTPEEVHAEEMALQDLLAQNV
jgi:hypothetical protein